MSKFDDNEIKYIKEVFDFVNENNEDFINFDDVKKCINALGGEINEKEEENLKMKENKFNFDDFVNICKQKHINLDNLTNKLLSAFKLLETNKLGYINKKEIENLLMNNIDEKEMNIFINEFNPDENGNINYEKITELMITNYNDL